MSTFSGNPHRGTPLKDTLLAIIIRLTNVDDSCKVINMTIFSEDTGFTNSSNPMTNSSSNLSDIAVAECFTKEKRLHEMGKVKKLD